MKIAESYPFEYLEVTGNFASVSMILDEFSEEGVKSLYDHFFSLKEFLDFFAHVPCSFFGEGECENQGGVDVFLFDHVCDLGGDSRGLASACAYEDQVGGLVCVLWLQASGVSGLRGETLTNKHHRFNRITKYVRIN